MQGLRAFFVSPKRNTQQGFFYSGRILRGKTGEFVGEICFALNLLLESAKNCFVKLQKKTVVITRPGML